MDEFGSLKELYIKIRPALILKKDELHKQGMKQIVEADIWNYLKKNKWMNTIDLSLSEMVNDILELDSEELDIFTKKELSKIERVLDIEEILDL
ncbi:MAG: post-transcriptional regulator [Bacilli bacterium]|nr:post-transcriptional regulator [Bacilli bacterium]